MAVSTDGLILDDREGGIFRVHRSAMTSPELLQLERERIFERCWLYVGHSSEIAEPGDYRRRDVAGRSIMFVRGKDREVRAFHNTCPHRGAIVCRQDAGSAKTFQCFYHAWTFNTEGRLVGIPGKEAYENTRFEVAERSLTHVPRLESYRDFWFLSYWSEIEPLDEYLGGAKEYLDIVCDQSLEGGMRIVSGSHHYSSRANWKLLPENSLDGYHGLPTHQTYFEYVAGVGGMSGDNGGKTGGRTFGGTAKALGNGHAVVETWVPWGRPVARWVPQMGEAVKPQIEACRAAMVQRHGAERAERITDYNRNLLIFPNLVINDILATTVRTFYPQQPDYMEINAWALAPIEEDGERLQARLHNFLEFLGPGGFATPDDVEALESCQIGYQAGGEEWNDVSRGMRHAEANDSDELQMRAFWREWAARIAGTRIDNWDDRPAATPAAMAR
jgi:p-cumate 2,3-dioxygenase alpha subunit